VTAPRLSCRDLQVRRGARFTLEVPALELAAGSVTALWGPNGSGKSTLLLACAGLLDVSAGRVALDDGAAHAGRAPGPLELRRQSVLVLQEPYLLKGSVQRNLMFGLALRRLPRAARQQRVSETLAGLGLDELQDSDVSRLSGGQRTLVAVARALALKPRVLLLDEVTRDLDAAHRQVVQRAVQQLAARGCAVLLATHDHETVDALAGRRVQLENGLIIGDAPHSLSSHGDN
jgi:tungstate transport system ATP-binding protein